MQIEPSTETAVLVVSCDKYDDLWPVFFHSYFKYWPDNPYPTYLLSNHRAYPDARVRPTLVGDDANWSTSLLETLSKLPAQRVILFLEDFFLTSRFDSTRILELERIMIAHGAACMRLYPEPAPTMVLPGAEGLGVIGKHDPWRVSTQPTIWDKAALMALLVPGESAWAFETEGAKRSAVDGSLFLSVDAEHTAAPILFWAVMRGRWTYRGLAYCLRERIPVDLRRRQAESLTVGVSRELRALLWQLDRLRAWRTLADASRPLRLRLGLHADRLRLWD